MSSAAVSALDGVEPNQLQPPSASPNPSAPITRPASQADIHAQPMPLDSPRLDGFRLPVPTPSHHPTSSSAGSSARSTPRADFQGSIPASPTIAPPRDGSPPADSSDDYVAHPPLGAQFASPFAPAAPTRPPSALRSSTSARNALEATPEYCELADAVKRTSPHVVRLVVRNLFNVCLLGSEYHLAFLTNTALHHAASSTLDRSVKDFGEKIVKSSKRHVVAHWTTQDLDEVADAILAKVSNEFLDKAMARRLETIRARELVNALARAERLGYDIQDIVEEKTANGAEHVVPCFDPTAALSLITHPASSQPPRTQLPGTGPALVPQHQVPGSHSGQVPRDLSTPVQKPTNPHGIVSCAKCGRLCSGEQALRYHITRRACDYTRLVERVGKDICPHCGCLFVSSGGLTYHVKSKVCGDYPEVVETMVLAGLHANRARGSLAPEEATPSVRTATSAPTPHKTPVQMAAAASASELPSSTTPSNGFSTPVGGPYAKLGPDERRCFEREMRQAEEKYGGLMQEAMKLPLPERENELTKIKNSYNSKQSMTRKKYGIRLRERRSKAELESERSRLLGASRNDFSAPSSKKPRLSEGQSASRTPESHSATAAGGLSGGLAGSSGPAEHTDPTTMLAPFEPRDIIQAQATPSATKGTLGDPMQIDDDSSDDTDSDDDDDIPATLSTRPA